MMMAPLRGLARRQEANRLIGPAARSQAKGNGEGERRPNWAIVKVCVAKWKPVSNPAHTHTPSGCMCPTPTVRLYACSRSSPTAHTPMRYSNSVAEAARVIELRLRATEAH